MAVVDVAAYDPSWPSRFEALKREYLAALVETRVDVVAIEHVGSTAVPGLAAKPVIDCDIVVEAVDVDAATAVLVSLGFTPLGELGIPQRWAFKEPARLAGTHTYVVVNGSLSLRNHLCLRETLRADSVLRDEYARVKRAGAAVASDIDGYGNFKSPIIQQILAIGGLSQDELSSVQSNQVPSHNELSP
jgi:GrpB-like predicted nucleotidyltransferase (UPF0157 family)